eukprot:2352941-Prymnesium_polylepis.1
MLFFLKHHLLRPQGVGAALMSPFGSSYALCTRDRVQCGVIRGSSDDFDCVRISHQSSKRPRGRSGARIVVPFMRARHTQPIKP